jgi:hypothetical protein
MPSHADSAAARELHNATVLRRLSQQHMQRSVAPRAGDSNGATAAQQRGGLSGLRVRRGFIHARPSAVPTATAGAHPSRRCLPLRLAYAYCSFVSSPAACCRKVFYSHCASPHPVLCMCPDDESEHAEAGTFWVCSVALAAEGAACREGGGRRQCRARAGDNHTRVVVR